MSEWIGVRMTGRDGQVSLQGLPEGPPWIRRLAKRLQTSRDHRHRGGGAMSYGRHRGPAPDDAKLAAVMMLIFPTVRPASSERQWIVPLTLRQPHLSVHAGQVSLPGGAMEDGESTWQAALRETEEELGVDPNVVQPVGPLTPLYVFNSNYLVFPWVAYTETRPAFHPNEHEVAQIVEFPVWPLPVRDPSHRMSIQRGGLQFSAPYWECGRQRIWGATSSILCELASLLSCLDQGETASDGPY